VKQSLLSCWSLIWIFIQHLRHNWFQLLWKEVWDLRIFVFSIHLHFQFTLSVKRYYFSYVCVEWNSNWPNVCWFRFVSFRLRYVCLWRCKGRGPFTIMKHLLSRIELLRDSEVSNFTNIFWTAVKYVIKLDISMNEVVSVHIFNRSQYISKYVFRSKNSSLYFISKSRWIMRINVIHDFFILKILFLFKVPVTELSKVTILHYEVYIVMKVIFYQLIKSNYIFVIELRPNIDLRVDLF